MRKRLLAALVVLAVAGSDCEAGAEARPRAKGPAGTLVYRIRPDFGRCEAQGCGGWLVSAVNRDATRCADGTLAAECPVSALAPKGRSLPDRDTLEALLLVPADRRALLAGVLDAARTKDSSSTGVLNVTEVWEPVGGGDERGSLFFVRDAGVRCVKAPCPSIGARLLNEDRELRIEEIDFAAARASASELAVASDALSDGGIIVAGSPSPGSSPDADVLLGARLYLRAAARPSR